MLSLKRISTALGMLALGAAPTLAQSANQSTADRVAQALRPGAERTGSVVEIEARGGMVMLSGRVSNPAVRMALLQQASRVAGVTGVTDRLQVGDPRVQPAQFLASNRQPAQVAMGGMFGHGHGGHGGYAGGGMAMDAGAPMVTEGAPAGFDGGPTPEGAMGASGPVGPGGANLPNYAWPSYAPYPNYSAVGYPTVYPWQAWPNIGPFYPYPEVPLDWRAVTLRWDDGLWWIDFKKHYTRPFFTPYPFGIFGY